MDGPGRRAVTAHRQGTTIVIADGGRAAAAKIVEERLQAGERVLAADLCSFGELKIVPKPEYIPADFMLAIATVGDRPLGVQSGQLLAIAGWLRKQEGKSPRVVAVGPRSSLIATVAAGLDSEAIGGLELHQSLGSLKEIIEQNLTAEHARALLFRTVGAFRCAAARGPRRTRPVHFHQPSAESARSWHRSPGCMRRSASISIPRDKERLYVRSARRRPETDPSGPRVRAQFDVVDTLPS